MFSGSMIILYGIIVLRKILVIKLNSLQGKTKSQYVLIFNKPGVAKAVLQTSLSFIN